MNIDYLPVLYNGSQNKISMRHFCYQLQEDRYRVGTKYDLSNLSNLSCFSLIGLIPKRLADVGNFQLCDIMKHFSNDGKIAIRPFGEIRKIMF